MTTKHEVEREVRCLQLAVAEAVAEPETVDLAEITAVLHQATTQVEALPRAASPGETVAVPTDRMDTYFPHDRPLRLPVSRTSPTHAGRPPWSAAGGTATRRRPRSV